MNFNTNQVYSNESIVLFADFDSANMARYERVIPNRIIPNNNQNNANSNGNNNGNNNSNNPNAPNSSDAPPNDSNEHKQIEHQKFDAEFNVWTKPDCDGSQYVNGNRTWFYFGVKGGHGKWIKFNIMNLNKQGRLFEMGMLPVFKIIPGHEKWSRIYTRPTWQNTDNNFQMSFCFHFPDKKNTVTYFAFCFPFSYDEYQTYLGKLDEEYKCCSDLKRNNCNPDMIYYHRELLCHSLDQRRVDLITVSACNNINFHREPRFDRKLFPDKKKPRPYSFSKKRVFVLTSRVHPGETPASYVFNGFFEFILNKDDPRARMLRKNFVFKLIPLLNPDGVARGHYRTDQLGMNLNRVYLDPSFTLHPTIYAAKSIIVYHHINNRVNKDSDGLRFDHIFDCDTDKGNSDDEEEGEKTKPVNVKKSINIEDPYKPVNKEENDELQKLINLKENNDYDRDNERLIENAIIKDLEEMLDNTSHHEREVFAHITDDAIRKFDNLHRQKTNIEMNFNELRASMNSPKSTKSNKIVLTPIAKTRSNSSSSSLFLDEKMKLKSARSINKSDIIYSASKYESRQDDSDLDDCHQERLNQNSNRTINNENNHEEKRIGNENSDEEDEAGVPTGKEKNSPHLNDPRLLLIDPLCSGIAFYVDLHGHAAKRGCFIYGNAIENEAHQIDNVLFAKLISFNSQHFDFEGCNFSLKNMYYKDKREGLSKEGSGRVALFKTIGLIHSYTLECCYASGRVMNTMAPAVNSQMYNGRISPPQHTDTPPKFLPEHYQNVGKGLAIAALDMTEINPCSRISNTTFGSLEAVRNWVKFYIRSKANPNKNNSNVKPQVTFLRSQVLNRQSSLQNNSVNENVKNIVNNKRGPNESLIRKASLNSDNTVSTLNSNISETINNARSMAMSKDVANGKKSLTAPASINPNIRNIANRRNNLIQNEEVSKANRLKKSSSINYPKQLVHSNSINNELNNRKTTQSYDQPPKPNKIPFRSINDAFVTEFIEKRLEQIDDEENDSDKEKKNTGRTKTSMQTLSESIPAHHVVGETSWYLADTTVENSDMNITTITLDTTLKADNENNEIERVERYPSKLSQPFFRSNTGTLLRNQSNNPSRELFPLNKASVLEVLQGSNDVAANTLALNRNVSRLSDMITAASNSRQAQSNQNKLNKKEKDSSLYNKKPNIKLPQQQQQQPLQINNSKTSSVNRKVSNKSKTEVKQISTILWQPPQHIQPVVQQALQPSRSFTQMQIGLNSQANLQVASEVYQPTQPQQQATISSILSNSNTKTKNKKVTQFDIKAKIAKRIAQQHEILMQETANDENLRKYLEAKNYKEKSMRDDGKNFKFNLKNVDKLDLSIKVNESNDTKAFWIDL